MLFHTKVAYEWKALAKPLHGFMQVVCIVGVDDGVDVTGNAHVGNVAQAGNQSLTRHLDICVM